MLKGFSEAKRTPVEKQRVANAGQNFYNDLKSGRVEDKEDCREWLERLGRIYMDANHPDWEKFEPRNSREEF